MSEIEKNYWLVGSILNGVDKADEFIQNGIWENGYDDNYIQRVKSVNIGDKIAIKSSYTKTKNLPFDNQNKAVAVMKIKAIGKVVNNLKDGKKLEVSWDSEFKPKEVFGFTYRNTFSKINKEKWQEPIKWIFENKEQDNFFSFSTIEDIDDDYEERSFSAHLKQTQPLNQILYGPPGTGKTYNTINRAIEIIEARNVSAYENREELKDKFEMYKKSGQIEFVTFHQSYGYEEFIEGIKAKTTDSGIEYKIEPGIFKKISKIAKENFVNSKKTSLEIKEEKSLKQKMEIFLNDALENETFFLKTKGGKFKIIELSQDEITIFAEDSNYSDKKLLMSIDEFYKILETKHELITSRQMAKDVFNITNQRQRDTYYFALSKKFHETTIEDIGEFYNEEPFKNYILIIDELNRGNISKIFGELITLIEPSKRIGADEEIRVKLPYSGEEFGVPVNLYIIGTMNTADRSIAPIDTALRRRFVFQEMPPKANLLRNRDEIYSDVDLGRLLEAINTRIEYLYDRDHMIGHAYLIDVETLDDLKFAFKNKIIPLLAEYFYEDWENIKLVLDDKKDKFITVREKANSPVLSSIDKSFNKKLYSVNNIDTLTEDDFILIYQQLNEQILEEVKA